MYGMRPTVIAVFSAIFFAVSDDVVAQDPAHDDFTTGITEKLREQDPDAADLFVRANAAVEREDFVEAERLYLQVLDRRPDFFHAARRAARVLLWQGRHVEALDFARRAFAVSDTPANRSALIDALLADPSAEAIAQARQLALPLVQTPDLEPEEIASVCLAAVNAEDLALLRQGSAYLRSTAPEQLLTAYWWWVTAMSSGDWRDADVAVERARELGLGDELYREMRADTDAVVPLVDRYKTLAAMIGGGWIAGLATLTLAGFLLSGLTLRAVGHPGAQSGEVSAMSGAVRGLYRAVLWLSCAFYYISLPLVVLAVVGVGGGLLYLFFAVGHIPIKLALIVLGLTLFTLFAILRSLFVRGRDEDPGQRLNLSAHPRIRDLLDRVAERIGTRPVDNVYLTPGTDLAVMERGGMLKLLRGSTERCLILGAGVLEGLKIRPFQAILAHEYGHFSNRDTAGGGFALSVRRSVMTLAIGLVEGGAAGWYNPAWVFLNVFQRVFLRISQGASRLQEILADRWAALAYGASAFETGLRHVIRRSIEFDAAANVVLQDAVTNRKPLDNLYEGVLSRDHGEPDLAGSVEAAINREPSPYDSHPSPADRFELVRRLEAAPRDDEAGPDEEVWSLFESKREIEQWMTQQVLESVRAVYAVEIAGEAEQVLEAATRLESDGNHEQALLAYAQIERDFPDTEAAHTAEISRKNLEESLRPANG
jgi:Zn-dependent protease with chaperone function